MIDSNFLYDESSDVLYILIYKLGKGSFSIVWFSLQIENFFSLIKNKGILKITPKALKIHNDDSYDQGIIETEITNTLVLNGKKCKNINYPTSYFIVDEITVIVVYDVAIGSLYDILKLLDKNLPIEFVHSILPQMIKPIEFMHKKKYIHSDIKPENYLLMGLSKLQKEILEYSNKYELTDKLRRIGNIKKFKLSNISEQVFQEPLNNFIKSVSKKFKLENNIIRSSDSDNESNYSDSNFCCEFDALKCYNIPKIEDDDKSIDSIYSFYSNISNESKKSDYNTIDSYDSRDDEYQSNLDNFHTETIIKLLFNIDTKCSPNSKPNKSNHPTELDFSDVKELLKNPIVKLTDFGTITEFKHKKYML
jgi:serine/threonine protein kinase